MDFLENETIIKAGGMLSCGLRVSSNETRPSSVWEVANILRPFPSWISIAKSYGNQIGTI